MKSVWPLLLMCLLGCGPKVREGPADVLDRERFKTVLLEAQLIEARMNHELIVRHQNDIPASDYYATMFTEQGTDKEAFERSFAYYSEDMDEMRAIYEEIFTELSRRKDEQPQ